MSALDDLHAAEAALEAAIAAAKAAETPAVALVVPDPEPALVVAVHANTSLALGFIGQPPVKGQDF